MAETTPGWEGRSPYSYPTNAFIRGDPVRKTLFKRRRQAQGRKSKPAAFGVALPQSEEQRRRRVRGSRPWSLCPKNTMYFRGAPLSERSGETRNSPAGCGHGMPTKKRGVRKGGPFPPLLGERFQRSAVCFRIAKYAFAALLRRVRKGKTILYGISFYPHECFHSRGTPNKPENA